MASLKIAICDSNHNFLENIVIDNSITKPDLYSPRYHAGRNKTIKMRSYSNKLVRCILETNGHYSDFSILNEQTIKRDGIMIIVPERIQLITSVPDDRHLVETYMSEKERKERQLLLIFSRMFNI